MGRCSGTVEREQHGTGQPAHPIHQAWSGHRPGHNRLVLPSHYSHPTRASFFPFAPADLLTQILTRIFWNMASPSCFQWKEQRRPRVSSTAEVSFARPMIKWRVLPETVRRIREYIHANPDLRNNKTKTVEGWGWDHTKWLQMSFPTAVRAYGLSDRSCCI